MSKMLDYDPNIRWTGKQCLDHKVFEYFKYMNDLDDVANIKAPFLIECTVDSDMVGNSPEECISIVYKLV